MTADVWEHVFGGEKKCSSVFGLNSNNFALQKMLKLNLLLHSNITVSGGQTCWGAVLVFWRFSN